MKIKYDTDGKEINHSHIVVKKGVCGVHLRGPELQ